MARYIDEIAAAGQAELNLPMYVNVGARATRSTRRRGEGGASGGADWPVLDVWKAAAPHIAIAAPDIYDRDYRSVIRHSSIIMRGPTIRCSCRRTATTCPSPASSGWRSARARSAGRRSAWTRPISITRSAGRISRPENLDAFASKFALLAPIARDWARLAFEHPTVGFAKADDASDQSAVMGRWKITAQYGLWAFGEPTGP